MRFPGFPHSPKSLRLSGHFGEQKVQLRLRGQEVQLCSKAGEVIYTYPLDSVSWHTCVLPTKEHCLCLCVPGTCSSGSGGRGTRQELLLRGKSREVVEELQRQLNDASMQHAQRSQHAALELQAIEAELLAGRGGTEACVVQRQPRRACHRPGQYPKEALQIRVDTRKDDPEGPDPRSLSFGSPVAEDAGGMSDSGSANFAAAGAGAADDGHWFSESESELDDDPDIEPGRRQAAGTSMHPATAPEYPVLPGIPLVARPSSAMATAGAVAAAAVPAGAAGVGRRHSASAPTSPCARLAVKPGPSTQQATVEPPLAQPMVQAPVRLLSFTGRPGEGAVQSHVQRLEAAVAQLRSELALQRQQGMAVAVAGKGDDSSSSMAGSPVKAAGEPWPDSQAHPGTAGTAAGVTSASHQALPGPANGTSPKRQSSPQPGSCCCAEAESRRSASGRGTSNSQDSRSMQLLLQENTLLLQQQAALQAELGRMQSQLSAAAADNIRLAQEAAGAVRQLQVAGEALRASQEREQQLHSSLAAAVGQCEVVGRELAAASSRLEGSNARCQELRSTVDALSQEKTVLAAALATAQLHIKDATPAGFAAETAELRQQAEAARQEAAAARAAAAAAEGQLAHAQRRETEVVGHMQEAARCLEAAQGARAAGLSREQRLAAEVQSLRRQLEGRLPPGDPASLKLLQERVDQLSSANAGLQGERATLAGQVQQMAAVGQELSGSCRALEVSLKAATQERDCLQAALSQAQTSHAAAQQRWEQEMQQLERERQQLERDLQAAREQAAGARDGMQGSRAAVDTLQAQVEGLRQELRDCQQRAAAREAELQSELKIAAVKAGAEAQAKAAEAARHQEQVQAREAELATARREAAALAAEQQRLQEELRRGREERAVVVRDLQLDASSAKAEGARLAQELHSARSMVEELRKGAEEGQRAAQQAQAQAAAAIAAHTDLRQERKELQGRLERVGVERDRAVRERDAVQLQYAALQQQYKLLEAVAHGQVLAMGGSKENGPGSGSVGRGGSGWGDFSIKTGGHCGRAVRGLAFSRGGSD